jgi:ectoine hydroxylase-related dioxygenase (phytanoyl-CoA dioxygenase family)
MWDKKDDLIMQDFAVTLTQEQIDTFHTNGFLSLEKITTNEEVQSLVPLYDEMFDNWREKPNFTPRDLAGKKGDQGEDKVIQMHELSKNLPQFATSRVRANAVAIAEQLLGPKCEFRTDHAISKPAGSLVDTAWHQDQWYWDPQAEFRRVSVWIPLQDVSEENGCMQFMSRQDVPDLITHHKENNDSDSNAWEADSSLFDMALKVACPLPAGGATIHYGKTLHFTSGNHSTEPRRAYIVSCGDPSTET